MIDDLQPYPEMRSPGLRWIEKIPANWEVRRNGQLFSIRRETGYPDLSILEVSIQTGVRVRDFDNNARKQQITDRSKYQRAGRGDIAYNMMRMWQGAVGVVPIDGLISPVYVAVRPFPKVDVAYFTYLFRTAAYRREIEIFSRGIVPDRNRLYWEAFKQIPSICPPFDEQCAIVRFLDWHGSHTSKLLRAKRRLISVLEEQKQAVIHRVATGGLCPDVQRKPSVEWLGEAPTHWRVRRQKYLTTGIEQGWSPQCYAQPAGEGEWGVLKVGCINGEVFDESQNKKLPENLEPPIDLEIKDGDILVMAYPVASGRSTD